MTPPPPPPPPLMCPASHTTTAPAIVIWADVYISDKTNRWTYWTTYKNSALVDVSRDGDFDFSQAGRPINVILTLKDKTRVFYAGKGLNVFAFSDDPSDYALVLPIPPGHHQFKHVWISNDAKIVSFCYANHNHGGDPSKPGQFPISRYAVYLGDGGPDPLTYWIDPKIGNGFSPPE